MTCAQTARRQTGEGIPGLGAKPVWRNGAEKRLFKGGSTTRATASMCLYTLENVVREMTQTLQTGEGILWCRFRALCRGQRDAHHQAGAGARRGQIVTAAEFELLKEESNQKLIDALDALRPFYKYDADGWGYADDAGAALTEGQRVSAKRSYHPESQAIIDDLLGCLRDMPTVYFEAKAQRAVQFSRFNTAVVPKGFAQDACRYWKDAGLKIKTMT